MPFPDGAPTKLVTLTVTSPAGGAPAVGSVRLSPNVPAIVIDGTPVQWTGGGTYQFNDQGQLVDGETVGVELLDNSAADSNPDGWLWHAIVNIGNQPRNFYFTLAGQPDEVDLAKLQELDPDTPDYVAVPGPQGPAGQAGTAGADGQDGAPGAAGPSAYQVAVIEGFAGTEAEWLASLVGPQGDAGPEGPQPPLGAAGDGPTIALRSDDPSTTNSRTPTAHKASHATGSSDPIAPSDIGAEAAGAATAAVGTHAGAIDPHGDRAYANGQFATQATVGAIDGYLGDALTRLQNIEQGTAFLDGGHYTGDVEVIDAELTVRTASGDVGRLRPTPWLFNVTDPAYGAKGDARVVADGVMGSGVAVLTSATANWPTDIAGKAISVKGAGSTGVTTLITTVASRQSATQITLGAVNASGGALSGAVVIWGTDDTVAIQAAVDAAEAYLATGRTYAQVIFPPRPYIVAGALNTAKSGNGQIVFGVYPTSGLKRTLEFRGETDGAAAVRHWEQTVPQYAGSCLISLGVYASTAAQTASLNANGNPAVICAPNEGTSNGLAYGASARFTNLMVLVRNLAIITTHSAFGLTYGALSLWGCANAHVENFGYGTAGTVATPSTDYTSPGTFGTGLSVGCLLPAPGNNDHVIAKNVSCGGGYTYAMFLTEHAVVDRYMALYCWAGLCAVGSYAGSVGSVHAMKVLSASIEACTNELYIVGPGSSGVGPIIDIDQLSTENSTPNVNGNSSGAMMAALGRVKLTGLFAEAGVSISSPTGIELVNGQIPSAIKRKTGAFTCSPIDRTLVCDTTAGGFTGTLPNADVNPVEYVFKNVGANDLTVATTSSQLIYTSSGTGATMATVTTGQTLRVQALYNGSAWGWYAV